VRLLTDSSGAVTDTYTYDAFGNLTASTGSTPNEYLYCGERLDGNSGFYYLRARYLNPQAGRFQTLDTFEGNTFKPKSLHKYLYASSDPINKIDPSGHAELSLAGNIGTLSINSTITAITALSLLSACSLQFALSDTAAMMGADISAARGPCVSPRRNEKYVYFAHGTSLESAQSINTIGVSYEAILEGGRNSEVKGAFFTFLLEPNPQEALQLAYEFSLRREPPNAVMVGKLPQRVFKSLRASNAVVTSDLTGSGGYQQTIFLPQSFGVLNSYNRGKWDIMPFNAGGSKP
jgi:RHS repeat-associated protein